MVSTINAKWYDTVIHIHPLAPPVAFYKSYLLNVFFNKVKE